MTVKEIFQREIKDSATLNFIKIMYVQNNEATERDLINFTALQLYELLDKKAQTFYKSGAYWYIVI